ncbi:MAG TPA: hypothetical protein VMD92_03265 [Acidobacteriaceae bacterium]|jgi:hypothetical protein|nr:hypothetical protein [Acidobacteriaceae bacterium]
MHGFDLSLLLSVSAIVISIASIAASLGKEWLQDRFGWKGRARLQIEVEKAYSHHMHGWIDQADRITHAEDWRGKPEDEKGERLKVHFYRAKVTNIGFVPARQITVWIKRFECVDSTSDKKALENIIPLRWSDFWRFVTDVERNKVTGGSTEITFPLLPEGCSKYCDLCFHLSYDGPPEVGGLKRNRAYFAVLNLPSSSYSIEGNSRYRADLLITAENARPLEAVLEVTTDFTAKDAVRMRLLGSDH